MQPPIALPDLVPVGGKETELWKRLRENPRERERQRTILSYPWEGRVLDIGIGHGYVACLIARAHRPDLIVGIDLETAWVKRARELAMANGIDGLVVVAARGERLPFPDRSFDRVLVAQVLEHVHHPTAVIREMARVLRPSGSALVAVPSHGKMPPGTVAGHVQDFTVADLLQELEAAGLETIEHRTVGVREFYFARPVAREDAASLGDDSNGRDAGPPDCWVDCPVCYGAGCVRCDGTGRMHPKAAGVLEDTLYHASIAYAQFHHLLLEHPRSTVGNEALLELGDTFSRYRAAWAEQGLEPPEDFDEIRVAAARRVLRNMEETLRLAQELSERRAKT